MRTHFYQIKGVRQTTPPNPGAVLNFQVGFHWEKVLSEALTYANVPFLEQYHMVDEEMNVEGTLDFAPYNPITEEWEVVDSKTESINASKFRGKKTFFENHPEYVHQLNTYCMLLRRQGFNVTKGRFVIIVKDNGFITEEETDFTEESLAETKERIVQLNTYLKNDELPPCECEGWKVNYCSFGDVGSIEPNSKGKKTPTRCCSEVLYKVGK